MVTSDQRLAALENFVAGLLYGHQNPDRVQRWWADQIAPATLGQEPAQSLDLSPPSDPPPP